MRTRSPSRAPPENGDEQVDREHADALALCRKRGHQRAVEVGLADAGDPEADDAGSCRRTAPAGHHLAQQRRASSTSEINRRPNAHPPRGLRPRRDVTRRPPAHRSSSETDSLTDRSARLQGDPRTRTIRKSSPSGSGHLDDQGVALATAAAQGGDAGAATAALELEGEVEHDPGAGHADRVAQGDRAAVDVDLVLGEAELAGRLDADRGEASLNSTRSTSSIEMPSFSSAFVVALAGCICSVESGPATWPCAPISAIQDRPSFLGLGLAHHHDGAGAVGDLRGGAGGDGAVLAERRAQLAASDSAVVSPRTPSSLFDDDRVALALRDLDRNDLVVENPRSSHASPRAGGERAANRPAPRASGRCRRR